MFFLISYDITDDRLRTKIAKTMEAFGERVQYSVFECHLRPPALRKLQALLKKRMDDAGPDDSIRFYNLCVRCQTNANVLGSGNVTENPAYYIA